MLCCFLLFSGVLAQTEHAPLYMQGDWDESFPYDEAMLFFAYVHPELAQEAEFLLASVRGTGDYHAIIQLLRGHFPEHIVGLLELTLALRYFNPKASIQNPVTGHKPILRGWAATQRHNIPQIEKDDFQWKLLSIIYGRKGDMDQLTLLRNITHSPHSHFPDISRFNYDKQIRDEYESKRFPTHLPHSLINGRSVSDDPIDILDALLNEYQHFGMMELLDMDARMRDAILYGNPSRRVFEYIPPLKGAPVLEHHDMGHTRKKWENTLKVNATEPIDFMRCQTPMIDCQIFLDLKSPETKAILEYVIRSCRTDAPFGFQIYLLADLNNETERHIAYSYRETSLLLGARPSAEYLLDGILRGFEKAYKGTRPNTPWNKLDDLVNKSKAHTLIMKQDEYVKQFGINELTITVNGQVLRDTPLFIHLKDKIIEQGSRWMDYAKRGQVTNTTDFREFSAEEGLPIDTIEAPLNISMANMLSIYGKDIKTIVEVVSTLLTNQPVYQSHPGKQYSRIPVFVVDCEPPKNLSVNVPFEVREARLDLASDTVQSILRVSPKMTIVGPLVFNHELTAEQLCYALHYVDLAFMDLLPTNMNAEQLLYTLLWRSSLGLRGIKRERPYTTPSPASIRIDGFEHMEWFCMMNPFAKEFRMTIEMMIQVSNLRIGRVSMLPAVPLDRVEFEDHLNHVFMPVILTSGCSRDNPGMNVIASPSWTKIKVNHTIIVQAVAMVGIAPGAKLVQIGDQRRVPLDNGYFVVFLPPNVHQTRGITEKYVHVNSLLPDVQFFTAKNQQISIPNDNRLHVLSFATSSAYENHTRMMLWTLQANVTSDVKLWLFGDFSTGIKGIDTTVLPSFWPVWLPPPRDHLWFCKIGRIALLDLFLPPEVKNILIVDQGIIFRGDASIFKKLDMQGAAIAAPIITTNKAGDMFWNKRNSIADRFKRPYHNSALAWIDMNKWREMRAGEIARELYVSFWESRSHLHQIDDEILNIMQMRVQVLTLPEKTAFCKKYGTHTLESEAFSLMMCDGESHLILGKEYYDIKDAAYAKF